VTAPGGTAVPILDALKGLPQAVKAGVATVSLTSPLTSSTCTNNINVTVPLGTTSISLIAANETGTKIDLNTLKLYCNGKP
jgi:hypothetical protein